MASDTENPSELVEFTNAEDGIVNIRTLTAIRWTALVGQLLAVVITHLVIGIPLPIIACLLVIAVSAAMNLATQLRLGPAKRFSEDIAWVSLAFDILQLSAMLFLTGGLENPFALLIMAPITVSATALSGRATLNLCAVAFLCVSALAVTRQPILWPGGPLPIDPVRLFGMWAALVVAIVFIAAYVLRVAQEARRIADAFAALQVALSREQRMSALGGLAAAVAHRLGTPLSTITLVANEMAREIPKDSEFAEDAELLRSESRRCKEILKDLTVVPDQSASPFADLPMSAVIEKASEQNQRDDIDIIVEKHGPDGPRDMDEVEPIISSSPEVLHAIGTLIQNASQFAEGAVEITLYWDDEKKCVLIEDDGPGFASQLLHRLGEPYVSSRKGRDGHMGLGVFIAQTLLRHCGAELAFSNRRHGGARVEIKWPGAPEFRAELL